MKRVCIIKQCYYPMHMHVRRDAETLAANGYEVDVLCLRRKGEKKEENIGGVNVYRLPGEHHRRSVLRYFFEYSAFFILVSLKLAQLSLKRRYDVVEVDTMPDFLVFTTLFPRLLGTKVILYMFENTPDLFASTFKKGEDHMGTKIMRLIERVSAGYAHRVISADGLPYKRVLESHGVPGEKIAVVLNVPNEEVFNTRSLPAPEEDGHFRLITHGVILKRYGVQTIVRAMPLLLEKIPELEVSVVGDGEYRSEVEKLARELGVNDRLHITGMVPHEMVPYYISRADVGIAPMIDDVGLPNKLFEYFALGKPSVVSALPSLTMTFDDNCVLYYQPDDEKGLASRVLELYHDRERRASVATQAQAFYKSCQWPVMKHEYLKVYEELLA